MSEEQNIQDEQKQKSNGQKPDVNTMSETPYVPTAIDQQLIENMEVHHHPDLHHEKKNFKEYFLEFLMIFLAVSMGFIAENLREYFSDREKEKQYIESLAVDLRQDIAACSKSADSVFKQVNKIDTLESVLSSPSLISNKDTTRKCYNLSGYILSEHSVNFSERTINQLLSSGNMRLLQTAVSDSVMDYISYLKNIETQRQFYINYTAKCIDLVGDYFQFRYVQTTMGKDTSLSLSAAHSGDPVMLTTDAVQLGKFCTTIEFTKRIAYSYMVDVILAKQKAYALLDFLQKQY